MQSVETIALMLGCIGMLYWAVCFWWMHRISSRQSAMLKELHEMTGRIEKFSQVEHALISDVHPKVSEIKEHVGSVKEVVSPENEVNYPFGARTRTPAGSKVVANLDSAVLQKSHKIRVCNTPTEIRSQIAPSWPSDFSHLMAKRVAILFHRPCSVPTY